MNQNLRSHYWFLYRKDLESEIKALKQVKKLVLKELKEAEERLTK
jgi:hypothetical protein